MESDQTCDVVRTNGGGVVWGWGGGRRGVREWGGGWGAGGGWGQGVGGVGWGQGVGECGVGAGALKFLESALFSG